MKGLLLELLGRFVWDLMRLVGENVSFMSL